MACNTPEMNKKTSDAAHHAHVLAMMCTADALAAPDAVSV
jgi:hypothetical protein